MDALLLLVTTIGFIPICLTILSLVLAVWVTIYWIQTLVRLMRVERGDDRLAWMIFVFVMHFLGALIYNAVRGTAPAPARPRETNWLASSTTNAPSPTNTIGISSLQITLLIVASLMGLIVLACLGLIALGSVPVRPLPTQASGGQPPINIDPTITAFTFIEPTRTLITANGILTDVAATANAQPPTPEATRTPYIINTCFCTDTPTP